MAHTSDRPLLAFLYLLPMSAVGGVLIIVGFLLDSIPLLPTAVSRGYQRALIGTLVRFATPIDAWTDHGTEQTVGSVASESTP